MASSSTTTSPLRSALSQRSNRTSVVPNRRPFYGLVPVRSRELGEILNDRGEFSWSFKETLAVRLLGETRAQRVWFFLSTPIRTVVTILVILGWVVFSVFEVFQLDIRNRAAFLAFSGMSLIVMCGVSFFFFDLRCVRLIVRTYFFLSNMAVASVATFSVSDMWDYDHRMTLSVGLLFVVAFISCADAFPPSLFRLLAPAILVLLEFSFFALIVGFNLGRIPGRFDRTYNFGTLDGLSTQNVTINVGQLATDSSITLAFLIGRYIYHTFRNRNSGHMSVISTRLQLSSIEKWGSIKGKRDLVASPRNLTVEEHMIASSGVSKVVEEESRENHQVTNEDDDEEELFHGFNRMLAFVERGTECCWRRSERYDQFGDDEDEEEEADSVRERIDWVRLPRFCRREDRDGDGGGGGGTSRPSGTKRRKLKYVPVYERDIYVLLDEDKRLKWNVDNTSNYLLFGPVRGRQLRLFVVGGKYGVLKLLATVLVCTLAMIIVVLRIFYVDESSMKAPPRLIILFTSSSFAYFTGFIVFFFFFDLEVMMVCALRRISFWAQIFAAVGLGVILLFMFEFDDRSILVGVLPLLISLSTAVDAFHPGLRRIVSLFILVVVWGSYLGLFAMFYLHRFPDEINDTLYLGNFNGLASRSVPFDLGQMASDIIFAEFILVSFMVYHALFHPHEASSVSVPIVSVDDATFSHFGWFPHQRRVSHYDMQLGTVVADFGEPPLHGGENLTPTISGGGTTSTSAFNGGTCDHRRSASSSATSTNPMFQLEAGSDDPRSGGSKENDLFEV